MRQHCKLWMGRDQGCVAVLVDTNKRDVVLKCVDVCLQ